MSMAAGLVKIRKVFEHAAHPNARDEEALNAVRSAKVIMDRLGLTFENMTFDKLGGGGSSPASLRTIQTIERLERSERTLKAEVGKLEVEVEQLIEENCELRARVEDLEGELEEKTKLLSAPAALIAHEPAETRAEPVPEEEMIHVTQAARAEEQPPVEAEQEVAAAPQPEAVTAAPEVEAEAETEAEPVLTKRAKKAKVPGSPKGFPFNDHPDVYKRTIELYFAGHGKTKIAEMLATEFQQAPNYTQVFAVTANGRPPAFLGTEVRTSGKTDWAELWLMGSTLFHERRSWIGPTLEAIGCARPSAGLSFDPNDHLDAEKLSKLREDYQFEIQNRTKSEA